MTVKKMIMNFFFCRTTLDQQLYLNLPLTSLFLLNPRHKGSRSLSFCLYVTLLTVQSQI